MLLDFFRNLNLALHVLLICQNPTTSHSSVCPLPSSRSLSGIGKGPCPAACQERDDDEDRKPSPDPNVPRARK